MNKPEPADRWFIALSPDGAARTMSLRCAKAFEEHSGPACKTFDSLAYRKVFDGMQKLRDDDMTVDLLNQSLVVSCLDFSATHLLVMALAPVTLFSLNLLRRQGVTTVHWFYEDFRRATYWKDVLAGYDHFFAIQRGPLVEACKAAGSNYHFLPTAATAFSPASPSSDRPYDVGFIGIPSPYRITVLELLLRKGFSIVIGGSGWNSYRGILQESIVNSRWVTDEDFFKIMGKSKIGINLSIDKPVDRELTHISPRVYDIMVAGCSLVSENVPLLPESLPGCDYYTFNSMEDVHQVVQKALVDYPASKNRCEKNRMLVVQRHTFRQRVEELMALTR